MMHRIKETLTGHKDHAEGERGHHGHHGHDESGTGSGLFSGGTGSVGTTESGGQPIAGSSDYESTGHTARSHGNQTSGRPGQIGYGQMMGNEDSSGFGIPTVERGAKYSSPSTGSRTDAVYNTGGAGGAAGFRGIGTAMGYNDNEADLSPKGGTTGETGLFSEQQQQQQQHTGRHAGTGEYRTPSSGERETTGSYYSPPTSRY